MTKYFVVKGKAGLGNRMLVALTAMVYAQLTGRKLVIDWSDGMYADAGRNAFPLLFDCPDVDPAGSVPAETDSIYPPIWRGKLHQPVNQLLEAQGGNELVRFDAVWRYSADIGQLDYEEDVLVMWGYLPQADVVRRHLRQRRHPDGSLSADRLLAKLLAERLVLRPAVRDVLEAFRSQFFADGHRTIGVHVRYSDNMRKRANAVLLSRYFRVIDPILQAEPNARIFLATDSRFVVDRFQQRYGQVLMTPKEYPPGGVAMHFNAERKDNFASAVEALVDMYLLADCDDLLYPGSSTFSYISALLSGLPSGRVVDLQRYDWRLRSKRLVQWWQLSGRYLLRA